MKTNILRTFLMTSGLLLASAATPAKAQDPFGPAYGPPPANQGFVAPLSVASDGPVWIGYTPIHDGLGYWNGYFTLGGLMPFFHSPNDSLSFVEAQAHASDQGNFFGNIALGRRIYERSIRRTFGLSFWYDFDGDKAEVFGHDFHQVGLSFDSLGDTVDLNVNVYVPVGNTAYTLGHRPGVSYAGNRLLYQQGLDFAMHGMDAQLTTKLPVLQALDLRGTLGGYAYASDVFDPFIGVSGGLEAHPAEYVSLMTKVTNDQYFNTTLMFNVAVHLGGRRQRPAYERLTEPVRRNDHIVRYHQDPLFATNPKSGQLYRILHVNNQAGAGGEGTFESPFGTLAEAQANSVDHDVIYVAAGDGTSNGMDTGIVLKFGQRLFGDGLGEAENSVFNINNPQIHYEFGPGVIQVSDLRSRIGHFVPTVELGNVVLPQLPSFESGTLPRIINPGGAAVTLASCTEVAGFTIDGAGNGTAVGVLGTGVDMVAIRDNAISNMTDSGIRLTNVSGPVYVARNSLLGNANQGLVVNNVGIPQLSLQVLDNTFNNNGRDGMSYIANGGQAFVRIAGTAVSTEPVGNIQTSVLQPFIRNGLSTRQGRGIVVDTTDQTLDLIISQNTVGQLVDMTDANGNIVATPSNGNNFLEIDPAGAIDVRVRGAVTANVLIGNDDARGTVGNTVVDSTGGSGIRIESVTGAGFVHTFNVQNNGIFNNNNRFDATGVGAPLPGNFGGIFLNTQGAGIVVFNLTNNTISRNGGISDDELNLQNAFTNNINGSGVIVRTQGVVGSQLQFTATNNTINQNLFDAFNFASQGDIFSNVVLTGNTFSENRDDAIKFTLQGNSTMNLVASSNLINSAITKSPGIIDTAFEVDLFGASRARVTLDNNTIASSGTGATFLDHAIDLSAHDNSQLIAIVQNNDIDTVTGSGILIFGEQNAEIVALVNNNQVTNSTGVGTAPAVMGGFNATINNNARICLALRNTTVDGLGLFLVNNSAGAAPQFRLEDTLGTNHFNNLPESLSFTTVGIITGVPVGSCDVFNTAAFPASRFVLP